MESTDEESEKKEGTGKYVAVAILGFLIMGIFSFWIYYSYRNRSGWFEDYAPKTSDNLREVPLCEGCQVYYEGEEAEALKQKKEIIINRGRSSLNTSTDSDAFDYSDESSDSIGSYGYFYIAIAMGLIVLGGITLFAVFSAQ